jgi:hypothetical protein
MTTVLFIHGTGERFASYSSALATVRDRLNTIGATVAPCHWGEFEGYRLRAGGVSIPGNEPQPAGLFDGGLSFGLAPNGADADEPWVELWGLLLDEPLLELRALAANAVPAVDDPGSNLRAELHALTIAALRPAEQDALAAAGLALALPMALANLRNDTVLATLLDGLPAAASEDGRAALARAILANATLEAQRQGHHPALLDSALLRDKALIVLLNGLSAASGDAVSYGPLQRLGSELLARTLTDPLKPLRGKLTNLALGIAGDILIYQGQGERIRRHILDELHKLTPPVVLLAHSLGGIASVDLLIEHDLRSHVPLLITVGSQAPIFYEMNALQALQYERPLPAHFPPWLNFFDKRDFLGFQAEPLFNTPNRVRVRDIVVNNRQPFPLAHTSYWQNDTLWNHVFAAVVDPQRALSH